jgi:hypothetical protein
VAMVALEGAGVWMPTMGVFGAAATTLTVGDTMLLDATLEEGQFIGTVTIDGGGSKTFGTSGSKIGWLAGATITFAAGSTLRVGLKTPVSTTAGNPARATTGAAAFNVYDDLVGGTDTIASTTWREDAMSTGTPFTVTDGDLLAICFHLTLSSGTPSLKVRGAATGTSPPHLPMATLVTSSGATFTQQNMAPNLVLTFNDSTLGWLEQSRVFATGASVAAAIGSGNSFGNIVRLPFPCVVDALAAYTSFAGAAADAAFEVWGTPLGTPGLLASSVLDANISASVTVSRMLVKRLPTPLTLAANTEYAIALSQTTAQSVTVFYDDVPFAAYNKPNGMGVNCYAANSTAGATFAVQNSGLRRYQIWMRVSAVDDGAGGALRTSRVPKREALRFARR